MAGQADGSIIIDTELNSDGFKAGSSELLAAIKSLSEEVKNLGTTLKELFTKPLTPEVDTSSAETKVAALEAQVQELEAAMEELRRNGTTAEPVTPHTNLGGTTQKASDLQRQIDAVNTSVERLEPTFQKAMSGGESSMATFDGKATALENKIAELQQRLEAAGQTKIPTEDYQWLTTEIAKANNELIKLYDRQAKMEGTGVKQNSSAWKNLQYDIQLARQKLAEYSAEAREMESSGSAFTMGFDTSQYAQMEATLSAASARLAEMRDGTSQSEGLMRRLASAARRVASGIGAAAKSAAGALVSGIKSAATHMAKMVFHGKSMNKQFGGLISGAKKFAISLLGARGVYALLRKAVSAYMAENQALSNTLSACWSGIGNLLGPIITRLINLVAQAVAYVTSFLKLFGVFGGSATKAINKAGGAAGGAAKELKRQLASFDELNILSDNSSGGGDGGGSSDVGAELPDVTLPDWAKLMVEQLKAGDWAAAAAALADQLSGMIASVDWAGIGQKIGYYLNGALTFLATFIQKFDWKALGSDLATLLNNVITSVDWGNLGVILTAKLAILLKGLTGFFETLDGAEFGKAIYDFIMGAINAADWVGCTGELSAAISKFINAIDFGKIGTALSTGMRTVLQSLNAGIVNFDWRGLGKQVASFINGIDWAGIIGDLATLISNTVVGALSALTGLAENIDWAKLGHDIFNSVKNVVTNIDWGQIVSLAFELIGAVIGGATSLVVALATDFWNLLKQGWESTKSYFVTYIEEAGGNVIEGLWNGIKNALANVGNWIVENIWNPFISGFKSAFGIASPSTKMAEMGGYIIEGLWNGIKAAWESIVEFFSNALDGIISVIKSAWEGIKSFTTTIWNGIKSGLSTVWSGVKSLASNVWNGMSSTVSSAWNGIKSFTSSTWSSIKSGLSTAWNGIKTTASTTWNNLKTTVSTGWNNIKSFTSTTWSGIKSELSAAWSDIKSNASAKWDKIKSTIADKGWLNIGTNVVNGIKKGIEDAWGKLKDSVGKLASNLLKWIKGLLGIHSPSTVFRDEVGLNMGFGIGVGFENSAPTILKSVSNIADAIEAELNDREYRADGIVSTAEVDSALMNFTDKISNSFSDLLNRMQSIADRVTFSTPAVAGGYTIPYKIESYLDRSNNIGESIEASNDALVSIVTQAISSATVRIVDAIQTYSGTTVSIDKNFMADTVISEINRKTRMTNRSPLIG